MGPPDFSAAQSQQQLEVTLAPSDTPPPANDTHRYEVKRFHARGGMGEIWVADDPHIGREVAVKRLKSSSQGIHDRFLAEAQVAGQLQHPCIVPVHDMGHDREGRPFYVMKFVRGKSLKQTIAEYHAGRAPTAAMPDLKRAHLLNVFVGICQAVAYAHSRGVLHRDIKPDNIMLGEYGEILLLDWGLAKVRGQSDLPTGSYSVRMTSTSDFHTEAGSIMGSPLYMPPEMAEGRIPDTDERTDIYLLGATLYEILTGKPPREGRSRDELLDLARTAHPLPPHRLCRIDRALEAICLKAMAWKKADRYTSVSQLLDDINRYLVGEPVSAYREPLRLRLWRWCKRHQVALKRASAAAAVLIIGTLAAAKWHQLELRRQQALAQAAELQSREQARLQIQDFDRQMDEARFYAASSDDVDERAPYFDPDKARAVEQAVLAAAQPWGEALEQLPLPNEAPRLRSRLYEMLLLMAQSQLQSPDPNSAATAHALLDRAAKLAGIPTRGYYRLLSRTLEQQGDPAAREQATHALDAQIPATAFDYFLVGEEWRRRAASSDDPGDTHASTDRISNLQQAVDNYRHALELDPTHYWAQFQLGRCYLSLGRTSEAVGVLGTCVALRPTSPWSYSARGMALGLLGQYDAALADLNHAIQLSPDFLPAVLNRGAVHWIQNDTTAALADFTSILQGPEDHRLMEAAFYRAQIYLKQGDIPHAQADLNAVLAAQPRFAPALLLRARVQLLQGNSSACLGDLNIWLLDTRGVEVSEHDANALEARGELLRTIAPDLPPDAMHAALEMARQDLDAAASLGDQSAKLYYSQGAVRELFGDIQGALASYSQSLQANPQNNACQLSRAWAYQKAGDNQRSADDFRAVIHRDSANAEAHVGLAYILACMGQFSTARDEASEALLTGSGDYLILHNVACVYAQISESEPGDKSDNQLTAIDMLRKAVQLWKVSPKGPDELHLIDQESAFSQALRDRPEFQQVIRQP
jgi:lipoprotein NlpI/tRNA A-37 threonylcarbamoyl transferase component Bud32